MAGDDLRPKLLRVLGQNASLSVKGIVHVTREDKKKVEQELRVMVRRGLCAEPFDGSFELTDRGKKEYKKIAPPPPPRMPLPFAPGWAEGQMFPADEEGIEIEEEESDAYTADDEESEFDDEREQDWDDFDE